MTKTISMLFATALLFTSACDSDEDTPTEDRAADLQADQDAQDAQDAGPRGMHGERGRMNPAEHLCAEIACSDEQVGQITALFEAHRPDFGGKGRRKGGEGNEEAFEAARAQANQTLAEAFRAERFDAAILDQLRPAPKHAANADARADEMVSLVTELHALLTPAQRATLADKIEQGGPGFMHGKRGHGEGERAKGARKGKRAGGGATKAKRSPEERLSKRVDGFCEPISCTDEQKTRLSAAFQGAHEARRAQHQGDKPDFEPLADVFRAETIDEAKLRERFVAARASMGGREGHKEGFADVIAEIHDILTPEQRSILADQIAEGGLRAVMGHGEGHGKRGKHGKHGKRDRQRVSADAE